METKRELNDILIHDDELQTQNRTKKLMMMIAMALVFLCILIAVVFVITSDDESSKSSESHQIATNQGFEPAGDSNTLPKPDSNTQDSSTDTFTNVPITQNSNNNDDRFQQILDDIRKRNGDTKNQQTNTNTTIAQNTPALPPKPATQNPTPPSIKTEPNKTATTDSKNESSKTANTSNQSNNKKDTKTTTQTGKKETPKASTTPTTANAQSNNIASAFEGVSTSSMDTSKNGQVAEKGFYVQVGSFANKPSAEFLKKISNYSYRVYAGTSNGQPTTKYLIGPYKSRTEAGRDLPSFKTLVADPVHFEVK